MFKIKKKTATIGKWSSTSIVDHGINIAVLDYFLVVTVFFLINVLLLLLCDRKAPESCEGATEKHCIVCVLIFNFNGKHCMCHCLLLVLSCDREAPEGRERATTKHCIIFILIFGSFGNGPMQSCSVYHVLSLLLSSVLSALVASVLASVYSPPSDRFDHRSFIS